MKPVPWLFPLSWLYGAGVGVRNWLYENGLLRTHNVGIPVVSVGNLSAGGTGKTPFVEYLARNLCDRGKKVAVLSRGFRRATKGYVVVSNGRQVCAEASASGDESAQMARNLEGVVIAVDEDRVHGASELLRAFHPDVMLLDDGFQHRALGRALDIVILSSEELLNVPKMLPAGLLREPLRALARADVLVVSGFADAEEYRHAASRLRTFDKPVVGIRKTVTGMTALVTGNPVNRERVAGRFAAFSGIGRPGGFHRSLREYLGDPLALEVFDDHHWYTPRDLQRLEHMAKNAGAEYLVTTQKDAVRLERIKELAELDGRIPLVVLAISVEVIDGEERLRKRMEEL